jgi:hypothetical protein
MDPNQALADARDAIARIDALEAEGRDAGQNDMEAIWYASVEATEAYRALDEWISKGGFLPEAWAPRDKDGFKKSEFGQ